MPDSNEDDFTALLAEHGPSLRKVTLTYGVSAEDREDLHQEILVQLWRSFASHDRTRPFATWMYRVALNVAISHVRRVVRGRRIFTAVEPPLDPLDPRTNEVPTTEGPTAERLSILQRLMAGLDEWDRALLLLHLEERSYREIADVLGLSESNVGTRLSRLRQRLRDLTDKEMKR